MRTLLLALCALLMASCGLASDGEYGTLTQALTPVQSWSESFEGGSCTAPWTCSESNIGTSTYAADGKLSLRLWEGESVSRAVDTTDWVMGTLDYSVVPYLGSAVVEVCNGAQCASASHPDTEPAPIPWESYSLDFSAVLPASQVLVTLSFPSDEQPAGARALFDLVSSSGEALDPVPLDSGPPPSDAGSTDAGTPAGDAGQPGDGGAPQDQGFGPVSWDTFERTDLGPAWRLLRPLAQIVDGGLGFGDSGEPVADAVFAVWDGYQFTTANQCSTVIVPDSYLGPSEMIQTAVRVDVDLCGNNQACRYGAVFDTNPGELGWRIKADGYLFGIGNYDTVESNPTTSEVFPGPTGLVPGMAIQLCAQDVDPTELTLSVDGAVVIHVFDWNEDQRVSGQPGIFCVYGVPGQPPGGAGTKCVEEWEGWEL